MMLLVLQAQLATDNSVQIKSLQNQQIQDFRKRKKWEIEKHMKDILLNLHLFSELEIRAEISQSFVYHELYLIYCDPIKLFNEQ